METVLAKRTGDHRAQDEVGASLAPVQQQAGVAGQNPLAVRAGENHRLRRDRGEVVTIEGDVENAGLGLRAGGGEAILSGVQRAAEVALMCPHKVVDDRDPMTELELNGTA